MQVNGYKMSKNCKKSSSHLGLCLLAIAWKEKEMLLTLLEINNFFVFYIQPYQLTQNEPLIPMFTFSIFEPMLHVSSNARGLTFILAQLRSSITGKA